jgi:hypothetical protein
MLEPAFSSGQASSVTIPRELGAPASDTGVLVGNENRSVRTMRTDLLRFLTRQPTITA